MWETCNTQCPPPCLHRRGVSDLGRHGTERARREREVKPEKIKSRKNNFKFATKFIKNSTKIILSGVQGRPGSVLGRVVAGLGRFGVIFYVFAVVLKGLWPVLGRIGPTLGCLGAVLARLGPTLGSLGAVLERLGAILGWSCGAVGSHFPHLEVIERSLKIIEKSSVFVGFCDAGRSKWWPHGGSNSAFEGLGDRLVSVLGASGGTRRVRPALASPGRLRWLAQASKTDRKHLLGAGETCRIGSGN